ncbi:MAG: hypothetical protein KIG55_02405 [Myroides sp.]|jgi:hypothetical protein|nr:hypothetical protein [uncultured Flavobacterium sp.]MBS7320430.1 hypothetical protein [Myroides sp.]
MQKTLFLILFALLSLSIFSQKSVDQQIESIKKEGVKLYKSEMASWYGTDIFIEQYQNKENIGGYLSYSEKDKNICIFYSNSNKPKVIGTIAFDDSFDITKANIDLTERAFNSTENQLYILRKKAQDIIYNDETSFFQHYENTKFNLIPLIEKEVSKVYLLTGPSISNVVVFGNDYLLTFNKQNELIDKKALHKNIIPIEFGEEGENIESTMHSHLPETGDLMTATDICTLMLYGKFTSWKKHLVVSENYLNIWNMADDSYHIMTMDAVNKIIEESDEE